jgi:carbonic anhydrase
VADSRRKDMTDVHRQVLAANERYEASFGDKGKLPMPPARRFAVLTCMDARLDPAKFSGLAEGDAHVVRNAGGRASDDAIRSLVISYKLLGTQEWFVIHHTDCGMQSFNDDTMRQLLRSSLKPAALQDGKWTDPGGNDGSVEGEFVDWLTIGDAVQAVVDDVRRLRSHPLVPASIPIYGYVYDCSTGRLNEVPDATAAGRAPPRGCRASGEIDPSGNGSTVPKRRPSAVTGCTILLAEARVAGRSLHP